MDRSPADCISEEQLLDSARSAERTASRSLEFNFPAAAIMAIEAVSFANAFRKEAALIKALATCEASAEDVMLQTAFLNFGIKPGAAFISIACSYGWRYRIDKGFHRADHWAMEKRGVIERLRRWLALKLWV